jgi:enamine deaminase RidA (YjgF/YER057c/UK114 family)
MFWDPPDETNGVCSKPGIYQFTIHGAGSYVGRYTKADRVLHEYARNVRKLLDKKSYRPANPAGFRRIHIELHKAVVEGRSIRLEILENVDPTYLNDRERYWIRRVPPELRLNGKRRPSRLKSRTSINAPDAPQPSGGYAQAVRLSDFDELVFISGQIPVGTDGAVPDTFAEQCRLVWRNVEAQLRAAGLGLADIVKVTTFLADRAHAQENSAIRQEVLAGLTPALTIIIAGIYDPAWRLEIEVVAAKGMR